MASIFDFPSRRAWIGLVFGAGIAYGALAVLDFEVHLAPILAFSSVAAAFAFGGYIYAKLRPHPHLFVMFMGFSYFTATAVAVGPLSFALTPFGGPLWDQRVAAFERSLGIDWPTLAGFMASSDALNRVWAYAYVSSFYQILLAILVLPGCGLSDRLAAYLKLFAGTLVATAVVACLFPTAGPIDLYQLSRTAREHLGAPGYDYLGQFFALRDGTLKSFDLAQMKGTVTFPSFHTIVAILCAWAFWPIRWLGRAALLLNAVVIISTIPWGGHYVPDILGGAVIALLGIAILAPRRRAEVTAIAPAPVAAE